MGLLNTDLTQKNFGVSPGGETAFIKFSGWTGNTQSVTKTFLSIFTGSRLIGALVRGMVGQEWAVSLKAQW